MTLGTFLCLFCFFYVFCNATAINVVKEYIGVHVLFNYISDDDGTINTLGSLEEENGAYGSDSPIVNASGLIQLPYHGFYENGREYGCDSDYAHVNTSQNWIALVARGQCEFSHKIFNAQRRNARGILVYDYKGQSTLVVMSHREADRIVAASLEFELGNTVTMLVWSGVNVFVTITKGNSHSPNGSFELQKTSIVFVSVAFMVLMLVSLAWLIFYYIQRFRLVHTHNRGRQRQKEVVRKVIAKIPSRSLKHDDQLIGEGTCAICLEVYNTGDCVRNLPCRHIFHKKCVDPWLLLKQTCPMCKVNVIKATEIGISDPVTPSNDDDVIASEEPCVHDDIERPLNPEPPKV